MNRKPVFCIECGEQTEQRDTARHTMCPPPECPAYDEFSCPVFCTEGCAS